MDLNSEVVAVIQAEARYWQNRVPGRTQDDLIQEGTLLALQAERREPNPIGFFRVVLRNRFRDMIRHAGLSRHDQLWELQSGPVPTPERVAIARLALHKLLSEEFQAVQYLLGTSGGWKARRERERLKQKLGGIHA